MYQYKGIEDTIVAISTPSGQGGIGIVRMSGKDALSIADKIFDCKSGKKPSSLKSHTVHYGWVRSNEDIVDEALLTVMKAPKSYTCEDVVEISCHGGTVPLKSILSLAAELGGRMSEPGEFTRRAFINGRIDLTQAEAVLDIIHSKTEAFLKVSHHQLKGELSTELEEIRKQLMQVYTEIEAIVNFPEDDEEAKNSQDKLLLQIKESRERLDRLLESSRHGKILKDGIKIVLCGKPNVGKSSLLNVLLKQPRAIVTDIAGTTRDTIEETAQIKGIPFQLIDTAGILEPRDLIEEEAVKRSRMYLDSADLILFVLDGSEPISNQDRDLMNAVKGRNVLAVINKSDLKSKLEEKELKEMADSRKFVRVSALKKSAISELEDEIVENVWHGRAVNTHGVLVSNIRHINALRECGADIEKTHELISEGHSLEFASEEVKSAVNRLDNITGRNIDNDLLDKIFSEFCIGK